MEQFYGKWVEYGTDKAAKRNFLEKLGSVPKEAIDKLCSLQSYVQVEKDGDYFKSTLGYIGDASLTNSFRYKLNESFSDVDCFGTKFTMTCRLEGKKFYDTIVYPDYTLESVREIADDGTLVSHSSTGGHSFVFKLKKE